MQRHVLNYFRALGYHLGDFIPCEVCGSKSVDIHHVEPRSKFGSKTKEEQDDVSNLVALCRPCHDKAHGPQSLGCKMQLKEIIKLRLQKGL